MYRKLKCELAPSPSPTRAFQSITRGLMYWKENWYNAVLVRLAFRRDQGYPKSLRDGTISEVIPTHSFMHAHTQQCQSAVAAAGKIGERVN
jgi:hypothetical protein